MNNVLKLVLSDHGFEEIKSGRKKHEYRKINDYWEKRLLNIEFTLGTTKAYTSKPLYYVEFRKAYRKNPERMTFKIDKFCIVYGKNTDLHINDLVFDIELGERIK